MDMNRRKQLLEEYRNRRPEMGVISLRCIRTGDVFIAPSKDVKADFNGTRFKLTSGTHPNQPLKKLWQEYGEAGFECTVLKEFKYEDPHEDHTAKLEALYEQCLAENNQARRIWK